MRLCNFLKKRVKISIFSIFLLSSNLESRVFNSPSSYGIGLPYGKALYRQCMPSLESMTDDEDTFFEVYPSMNMYSRNIDKAYGNCDLSKTNDLSSLFHGKDSFSLNELFTNSQIPKDFKFDGMIEDITINPSYNYSEKGCVLGVSAQREREINGRTWNIRVHAHLPIKELEVRNETGYDSLGFDTVSLPTTVTKNWVDFKSDENGNEVFAIRLDKAIDSGLIKTTQNVEDYFVVSPNIELVDGTTLTTDAAMDKISIDDALLGNMIGNDGTPNKDIFLPNNITMNVTLNDSVGGAPNRTSVLTLMAANEAIATFSLYNSVNNLNVVSGSINLLVSPVLVDKFKSSATNGIFVNQNGDGTTNPEYVIGKILKNSEFNVYAIPKDSRDPVVTTNPVVKNVNFNVPVVIQKSTEFPNEYGKEITLPEHAADLTNFTYAAYADAPNFAKVSGNITKTFVYDNENTEPGYFFYDKDITGLETCNNLQDYWITTALDSDGNPTKESEDFFKALESKMITSSSSGVDEKLYGKEIAKMAIQGWFENGGTIGNDLKSPSMKNGWNNYKKRGLGDLDLEISMGSQFFENKLSADLILGAILPTSEIVNYKDNYLTTPLGNNGHFEFRAGLQSAYDLNSWIRLSGYAHASAAMSARENLTASFKGARAFGLQPHTIYADVSWQNLVASFDLSMFANEWTSLSMKYQFNYKTKDDFSNCSKKAKDAFGYFNDVDLSFLKNTSGRESHKIIGALSTSVNKDVFLSFGASTIFAGKNIGQENEVFLTAVISY